MTCDSEIAHPCLPISEIVWWRRKVVLESQPIVIARTRYQDIQERWDGGRVRCLWVCSRPLPLPTTLFCFLRFGDKSDISLEFLERQGHSFRAPTFPLVLRTWTIYIFYIKPPPPPSLFPTPSPTSHIYLFVFISNNLPIYCYF